MSVLIISFNRAAFVGDAIRSILGQTLGDLECILVDDGSTDNTAEILGHFDDPRLRLVRQGRNMGIPASRNRALKLARGRFIAWLDSDDISHPDRLRLQHDFLEQHPDTAMVGSAARTIDASGKRRRGGRVPLRAHDDIRSLLLFRSPFQQSSIFGRAHLLKQFPYDPSFPLCEDVDMFARFTGDHRVANLPAFLIDRRIHRHQTIRANVAPILAMKARISARFLDQLEMHYRPDELDRHVALAGSLDHGVNRDVVDWARDWLPRLSEANRRTGIFPRRAFERCLDRVYLKAALKTTSARPAPMLRLASDFVRRPAAASGFARDAFTRLVG